MMIYTFEVKMTLLHGHVCTCLMFSIGIYIQAYNGLVEGNYRAKRKFTNFENLGSHFFL